MAKKVLIVGGSAGGASAAARVRRLDEEAKIIVIEKSSLISTANCGLPYYIGEVITNRDKLLIQTPEAMNKRFNIDVRVESAVTGLDTNRKIVKVKTNDGRDYEENYDYLIISPGCKPLIPKIPGISGSKVFTLRDINDSERIKEHIKRSSVKKAVVVGGGYIGVEVAENLSKQKVQVTIVDASSHILASFDKDIIPMVEKELNENGVALVLGKEVKAFCDTGEELECVIEDGRTLTAQMIILAAGVVPDTMFLKGSGIELEENGHIVTDEYMKTNAADVYAVGDAVMVSDYVTGLKIAAPLAGPANRQGRIAANNICGLESTYKGTQGTAILKIFNLSAAATGVNEVTLKKLKMSYKTVFLHPMSHASYYPEASQMTIKLLFSDKGTVLGAQVIGYEAVDKTIDVIATVIRLHGSIHDLTELELAYAPPYSSAKSPINMAGFAAENVLRGSMEVFVPTNLQNSSEKNIQLIDVRTPTEYENGHLNGALNIPVDELRNRLEELDKNKKTMVYCQVGLRGYIASRILKQKGYKVENLTGGYKSALTLTYSPKQEIEADSEGEEKVMDNGENTERKNTAKKDICKEIDACGLSCPGPIMELKSNIESIQDGETIRIKATDPGFYEDVKAWCNKTNNELKELNKDGANIVAVIQKGENGLKKSEAAADSEGAQGKDNKTIIVFSGDLDKAIAAFIIANGAVSMGKKVTMFFTFWGINIIRKPKRIRADKDLIEKLFGAMMPRGTKKLKLSKMNMAGIGPKMIRGIMKKKNVNSLEELIKSGMESGIEMVACQMSMELLGFKKEELIDGVRIGGVGYYLGEADDSNVNLFI